MKFFKEGIDWTDECRGPGMFLADGKSYVDFPFEDGDTLDKLKHDWPGYADESPEA